MNQNHTILYGTNDVIMPDWKKIIPFQIFNLMNLFWYFVIIGTIKYGRIEFPWILFFLAAVWNYVSLIIWNLKAKYDKNIYIRTGVKGLSMNVPAFSGSYFF